MTAEEFAGDILGFEEYEEGEEEEGAAEQTAGAGPDAMKTTGMGGMGVNEVIPEEEGF